MADDPIDAREMIAAYRAVARPRPAVRQRIARALQAPARAPRWPYVVVAVAMAAAIVASFGWPNAWLDRSPVEQRRPEAPYEDATPPQLGRVESRSSPHVAEEAKAATIVETRAVEHAEAPRDPPQDANARRPVARRDAPNKPREPAPAPTRATPPKNPADGDDLLAEMALLERARSRLAAGRRTDALAIVDEHARAFPDGALGEERDALRVIASCGLPGRAESALAARLAFARDYPRSTYADRVRRACIDVAESSAETDIP